MEYEDEAMTAQDAGPEGEMVDAESAEIVQASVRAFARFVQWEISGDPKDEAAYQAEVDRVAELLGDDPAAPSEEKESGMALSEATFMQRCQTLHTREKCVRLWATRHGDGPS